MTEPRDLFVSALSSLYYYYFPFSYKESHSYICKISHKLERMLYVLLTNNLVTCKLYAIWTWKLRARLASCHQLIAD